MGKRRRQEILQRVQQHGYVSARELAEQYGVDTSTVRRDLDALARLGMVARNHGGASLPAHPGAQADGAGSGRLAQKRAIAQAVAGMIADGSSLLMDSGSTALEVARALRDRRGLTVVTNDLRVAAELATHDDLRLIVPGGEVLPDVHTLMSERAVELVATEYHVDYAVLGADAVDPRGITNISSFEAPLKRAMIRAGTEVILAADSGKFGRSALVRVAPLDGIGVVVTDDGLPQDVAATYPVRVVRVPVPAPGRPQPLPVPGIPAQHGARRDAPRGTQVSSASQPAMASPASVRVSSAS